MNEVASLKIQLKVLGDCRSYAEAALRRRLLNRLAAAIAANFTPSPKEILGKYVSTGAGFRVSPKIIPLLA